MSIINFINSPNPSALRKLELFVSSKEYINGEVLKEIPSTNSQYFITNYGRVISLAYNKARVLKPYICGDGYYYVDIFGKNKRVHILVAKAFISNPYNKPYVHHLDYNKLNNMSNNLIWLTSTEHGLLHRKNKKYA